MTVLPLSNEALLACAKVVTPKVQATLASTLDASVFSGFELLNELKPFNECVMKMRERRNTEMVVDGDDSLQMDDLTFSCTCGAVSSLTESVHSTSCFINIRKNLLSKVRDIIVLALSNVLSNEATHLIFSKADVSYSTSPEVSSVIIDSIWSLWVELMSVYTIVNEKDFAGIDANEVEKKQNEAKEGLIKRFGIIVRVLSDKSIISRALVIERLELDLIGATGIYSSELLKRKLIKKNTRNFYTQLKYNLLSEETEGYSKLLEALLRPVSSKVEIEELKTDVLSLVGRFGLDPNRVFDLILDAYDLRVARSTHLSDSSAVEIADPSLKAFSDLSVMKIPEVAFLQLLNGDLFSKVNLGQLLGFKLSQFASSPSDLSAEEMEIIGYKLPASAETAVPPVTASSTATVAGASSAGVTAAAAVPVPVTATKRRTPEALLTVTAVLIACQFVSLSDIWCHIGPTPQESNWAAQAVFDAVTSTARLPGSRLAPSLLDISNANPTSTISTPSSSSSSSSSLITKIREVNVGPGHGMVAGTSAPGTTPCHRKRSIIEKYHQKVSLAAAFFRIGSSMFAVQLLRMIVMESISMKGYDLKQGLPVETVAKDWWNKWNERGELKTIVSDIVNVLKVTVSVGPMELPILDANKGVMDFCAFPSIAEAAGLLVEKLLNVDELFPETSPGAVLRAKSVSTSIAENSSHLSDFDEFPSSCTANASGTSNVIDFDELDQPARDDSLPHPFLALSRTPFAVPLRTVEGFSRALPSLLCFLGAHLTSTPSLYTKILRCVVGLPSASFLPAIPLLVPETLNSVFVNNTQTPAASPTSPLSMQEQVATTPAFLKNRSRWISLPRELRVRLLSCLRNLLIPILSLSGPSPMASLLVWDALGALPWTIRHAFYAHWQALILQRLDSLNSVNSSSTTAPGGSFPGNQAHPYLLTAVTRLIHLTRQASKRLARETLALAQLQLALLAAQAPIQVLDTVVASLESTDNLVPLLVDVCDTLSPLSHDILVYVVCERLSRLAPDFAAAAAKGKYKNRGRERVLDDGVTPSRWVNALASIAGLLFRRYAYLEPMPLLLRLLSAACGQSPVGLGLPRFFGLSLEGDQFSLSFVDAAGRSDFSLLQVLKSLLSTCTGITELSSLTVSQQNALGGSLLLRNLTLSEHSIIQVSSVPSNNNSNNPTSSSAPSTSSNPNSSTSGDIVAALTERLAIVARTMRASSKLLRSLFGVDDVVSVLQALRAAGEETPDPLNDLLSVKMDPVGPALAVSLYNLEERLVYGVPWASKPLIFAPAEPQAGELSLDLEDFNKCALISGPFFESFSDGSAPIPPRLIAAQVDVVRSARRLLLQVLRSRLADFSTSENSIHSIGLGLDIEALESSISRSSLPPVAKAELNRALSGPIPLSELEKLASTTIQAQGDASIGQLGILSSKLSLPDVLCPIHEYEGAIQALQGIQKSVRAAADSARTASARNSAEGVLRRVNDSLTQLQTELGAQRDRTTAVRSILKSLNAFSLLGVDSGVVVEANSKECQSSNLGRFFRQFLLPRALQSLDEALFVATFLVSVSSPSSTENEETFKFLSNILTFCLLPALQSLPAATESEADCLAVLFQRVVDAVFAACPAGQREELETLLARPTGELSGKKEFVSGADEEGEVVVSTLPGVVLVATALQTLCSALLDTVTALLDSSLKKSTLVFLRTVLNLIPFRFSDAQTLHTRISSLEADPAPDVKALAPALCGLLEKRFATAFEALKTKKKKEKAKLEKLAQTQAQAQAQQQPQQAQPQPPQKQQQPPSKNQGPAPSQKKEPTIEKQGNKESKIPSSTSSSGAKPIASEKTAPQPQPPKEAKSSNQSSQVTEVTVVKKRKVDIPLAAPSSSASSHSSAGPSSSSVSSGHGSRSYSARSQSSTASGPTSSSNPPASSNTASTSIVRNRDSEQSTPSSTNSSSATNAPNANTSSSSNVNRGRPNTSSSNVTTSTAPTSTSTSSIPTAKSSLPRSTSTNSDSSNINANVNQSNLVRERSKESSGPSSSRDTRDIRDTRDTRYTDRERDRYRANDRDRDPYDSRVRQDIRSDSYGDRQDSNYRDRDREWDRGRDRDDRYTSSSSDNRDKDRKPNSSSSSNIPNIKGGSSNTSAKANSSSVPAKSSGGSNSSSNAGYSSSTSNTNNNINNNRNLPRNDDRRDDRRDQTLSSGSNNPNRGSSSNDSTSTTGSKANQGNSSSQSASNQKRARDFEDNTNGKRRRN